MDVLRVKVEIPQEKGDTWRVGAQNPDSKNLNMAKRKDVTLVYRWVERKIIKYFGKSSRPAKRKTVIYVKDGQYHNDGEYTRPDEALYALTAFLEDYLNKGFRDGRYKKYGYFS